MAVRSYGPDTDFGNVCTVTLILKIHVWPWVKVMTHPWVMDNIWVKYYPDPICPWGVMAWTRILVYVCNVTFTLEDMTLGQGHGTPLDHGQQLCKILSSSNMAVRSYGLDLRIFGMCVLWPWPWKFDFGSRSWHTLGPWTTIVWNIIQIQHSSEELWPGHGYLGMCALWPWPWRYDLESRSWHWRLRHTLWSWATIVWNIIKIQHSSEELWPGHEISGMCALWPWPWTYYLGSRSWHTLGSWTTIVWNIIQIGRGSKKLWPGHDVNRRTDRVVPI